jgi:uncharacterized membrane protein YqhA
LVWISAINSQQSAAESVAAANVNRPKSRTGGQCALDVFLISIVAYIISLGLYTLFIDDALPLPRWLRIQDLEDLKNHMVSVVVAVLAVLFLQEAVARAADLDLLSLAIALALMIAALTFFLTIRGGGRH